MTTGPHHNPDPDNDEILQQIVITKVITPEGIEAYHCEFNDKFNATGLIPWLDGLGLLEAAKVDLQHQHFCDHGEEDEDRQ